jgi:hypothetical protein
MSMLWLNIRFWLWHLQIGEPHWWSVRWTRNDYYVKYPRFYRRHPRIEIYTLFGWQKHFDRDNP